MQVWDWDFALSIIPTLLRGLLVTFEAVALGSVLAFGLGLVLVAMRLSSIGPVRVVAWAIIEAVRSTPLLIQLYFWYFALPAFGIVLGSLTAGVIGIGLHYATYSAEVYRAGIDAVPRGQWEAARSLSFSAPRTWISIILPQAIPRVIPALGNFVIGMFKETPLLLSIGVLDFVGEARALGSGTYRYVEPYTMVGVLFLLMCYPASILVRRLERGVYRESTKAG